MGKLKAGYYLKNNKKRAAILIISFGLYFALLYGVNFFINPMYYTDEAVYLIDRELMQLSYINEAGKLPMDMSLWDEASESTNEDKVVELNRAINEFAAELEKDDRIDHVIQCFTYGINIHTFTGSTYYEVPMVTKEESKVICDYMGVELIEGTYPQKAGDIVMDEKMAKNRKVKVGDTLYDSFTRVCGIVSSNGYFAVGIEYDDELMVKRYLAFLDQGTVKDLKEFFLQYDWEASNKTSSEIQIVYDVKNSEEVIEGFKKEIQQPLGVMVYTITIVMGITLYFVYQLHIRDRYEEWCLYRSLGYSQGEVFGLALREYGICIIGSILLTLFFLLVIFVFGVSVMQEKGIVFHLWMPEPFLQLIGTMVFLTGVLQIPVFQAMQHITTIDAIEDDI